MTDNRPPRELLAKMGTDWIAITSSLACLVAALAVQNGIDEPPKVTVSMVAGRPLPPDVVAVIDQQILEARDDFRTARPEQVEDCIVLYREHLAYCGIRLNEEAIH